MRRAKKPLRSTGTGWARARRRAGHGLRRRLGRRRGSLLDDLLDDGLDHGLDGGRGVRLGAAGGVQRPLSSCSGV